MRSIRVFGNSVRFFLFGGLGYGLIELLWRGRTHWSMFLAGGASLLLLIRINRDFSRLVLPVRCLIGSFAITAIELIVGCTVNLNLGLQVWDYSKHPFNLLGQICPLYSFYWFLLCFPIFFLCSFLKEPATKDHS